jgi:glycosyltransferase involved in cell wall biosynthesis
MATGLPSLAVSAGGVLEFAQHGNNAWLVAPNSGPAIIEGLDRLMSDAALRGRLTQGALATAAERGWDAIYDSLLDDYRYAMARKRLTRAA